jgi:hypothetical protein
MKTKNLDIHGSEPIPWGRARDGLAAARGPGAAFFLGAVCPDGKQFESSAARWPISQ